MSVRVAGYNGSQIIVDDRNHTMITYDGNWVKGGVTGEYNSTEEGSWHEGDFATFIFNGTSVAVYGTIPINTPPATQATAQFVLDNGSPVQYTAPLVPEIMQQQLEYSSGPVPDGQHKLVITHTNGEALTNQFWIDYFLIMHFNKPSLSNQSSETSTPITGSGSTVPTQGPAGGNTSGNTNTAAIAGGVVAGVVLIVAAILVVYFLYWRRRRKTQNLQFVGSILPKFLGHIGSILSLEI